MKKQRLNRIIAFLTALLLVVGMLGPRAYAAEAQKLLLGDANGDNMLDVRDAAAILKEYAHASTGAEGSTLTPEQLTVADIDNNGLVDSIDATIVLRYLANDPSLNTATSATPDPNLTITSGHKDDGDNTDVKLSFLCDGKDEVTVVSGTSVTLSVSVPLTCTADAGSIDVQFACSDSSGKIEISQIKTGDAFEYLSWFVNLDELRYVGAASDTVVIEDNAFTLTVVVPEDTPAGTYTLGLSDRYMAFGKPTEDMLFMSFTPLTITVLKPKAEIKTEPEEKMLLHEDTPQELVEPGTASGGTMQYALGEDNIDEPESGWSTDIPTGDEAGSYYVWAKAAGDQDHRDSDAVCKVSKIVHKVTFKVAGGSWNDKTAEDVVLPLSRYENEDLALVVNEDDIPAVGAEPAKGFLPSGSWDGTFDKMITQDTVYTYTYDEDPDYVPDDVTGDITFSGKLSLNGRDLTESDIFRFEITDGTELIATAASDKTGKISFPKISYDVNDIGDHTYYVKQAATDIAGVTIDETEYKVSVRVFYTKGNTGLTVNPSEEFSALYFTNTFSPVKPDYTVPTGLTATYGQTLADVILPSGWTWNDESATSVGDIGENAFSATFTPDDTVTYTTATEKLTITVKKIAAPKELTDAQKPIAIEGLKENGSDQTLLTAPKELPDGYTIEYSTEATNWSATIPTGKDAGEYNIQTRYVGDKNHEDFTGETIKVTIAEKEKEKETYTVIWLDGDGKELDKKTYLEGEVEPTTDKKATKAEDTANTYVFDKWDDGSVSGNTKTYKPLFKATAKTTYTIIWLDGDGKKLDTKTCVEGSTEPTTDKKATKAEDDTNTYIFDKWDEGTLSGTTKTYKPLFKAIAKTVYTVIWLDGDGKELDKKTYTEGKTEPTTDKKPVKANENSFYFEFDKWDNGTVSGTTKTYTPSFTKKPLYTSEIETLEHTMGDTKEKTVRIVGNQNNTGMVGRVKTIGTTAKNAEFGKDVTLAEGSLLITFAPSYLDSLGVGEHQLRVAFDDGEVTFRIIIKAAEIVPTPKTSDNAPLVVWMILMVTSLAGIGGMFVWRKKQRA